jgi:di/tricarboxylate transporter
MGWQIIFVMLGLIALYLILVYSGGATKILTALGSVVSAQTKTLQGR